jgi:hypothetical protein
MKRLLLFILGLIIAFGVPILVKYKYIAGGEVTNGKVVGVKSKLDVEGHTFTRFEEGVADYFAVIEYTVNGQEYQFLGPENMFDVNEVVEVRYVAGDPADAKVNSFAGLFLDAYLLLTVLFLLLWSAVVFSFVKK